MGFSRQQAVKALKESGNYIDRSVEWLLLNGGIDEETVTSGRVHESEVEPELVLNNGPNVQPLNERNNDSAPVTSPLYPKVPDERVSSDWVRQERIAIQERLSLLEEYERSSQLLKDADARVQEQAKYREQLATQRAAIAERLSEHDSLVTENLVAVHQGDDVSVYQSYENSLIGSVPAGSMMKSVSERSAPLVSASPFKSVSVRSGYSGYGYQGHAQPSVSSHERINVAVHPTIPVFTTRRSVSSVASLPSIAISVSAITVPFSVSKSVSIVSEIASVEPQAQEVHLIVDEGVKTTDFVSESSAVPAESVSAHTDGELVPVDLASNDDKHSVATHETGSDWELTSV